MPRQGTFRINRLDIFLTYAQVGNAFTANELQHFIHTRTGADPVCSRIGTEAHADGNTHFHVYAKWSKKLDTADARYFDFRGFHPNIENPKKASDVWAYCGKDGNVLDFGIPPAIKRTYGDILAAATTEAEFMDECAKAFPRDYVLQHERLEYFSRKKYKREQLPYADPYNGNFNVPPILDTWVSDNLQSDNVGKLTLRLALLRI